MKRCPVVCSLNTRVTEEVRILQVEVYVNQMLKLLKGQREREKEKGTACNQKYISRICISTRRKSKENTTDTKIKCDIHCCSTVQRKITQRTQFFHSRTLLLDKTVTTHDLSIVPFQ